jgi:hypothetical protein
LQAPKSKANPRHYAPGNHAPALLRQLPWQGHPRHCATLCGEVSNDPVALCHPLPHGRRAAPSKKDDGALEGKMNNYATPVRGQRCDVGSAGPVTSVAIGPVRPFPPSPTPSRPLHHHPRHYGSVRRRDTTTPATVPPYVLTSTAPSSPHTGGRRTGHLYTSKPLLDAHRTRHDVPPEARFARTVVYSATLYTMPLHVD